MLLSFPCGTWTTGCSQTVTVSDRVASSIPKKPPTEEPPRWLKCVDCLRGPRWTSPGYLVQHILHLVSGVSVLKHTCVGVEGLHSCVKRIHVWFILHGSKEPVVDGPSISSSQPRAASAAFLTTSNLTSLLSRYISSLTKCLIHQWELADGVKEIVWHQMILLVPSPSVDQFMKGAPCFPNNSFEIPLINWDWYSISFFEQVGRAVTTWAFVTVLISVTGGAVGNQNFTV